MSSRVTCSSTLRRLALVAIQTRSSGLAGPLVVELLGRLAAHVGQRALDGTDHVGDRDLRRRAGEPVAAVGATLAADDARPTQLRQDVLEVLGGDALGLAELVALGGPVGTAR